MECHCYLRNIQDLLSDGKTPYERRFGMHLNGPVMPFGAMVEYHPISAKDTSRLHQYGPKVLPGIFLGYAMYAGGIWKGDIEELEQMDGSEIHARRLNAREVLAPVKNDNFIFPVADATEKLWRRSTSETIHLNQGSSRTRTGNKKFYEEHQTDSVLQTPFKMTQHGMMRKLKMTSGLLREISFIASTWNPESNCTCRKKNHFPFR